MVNKTERHEIEDLVAAARSSGLYMVKSVSAVG